MALIRFWVTAVDVVDVEVADVLPGLFEAEVRIAHRDEIGFLRAFQLCPLSDEGIRYPRDLTPPILRSLLHSFLQ